MDDTMADTGHVGETDMAFEPADQKVCCGTMTGCGDDEGDGLFCAVLDGQSWLGQADALDFAGEQPRGRRVGAVEGELDAGGTTIDRQDAADRLLIGLAAS